MASIKRDINPALRQPPSAHSIPYSTKIQSFLAIFDEKDLGKMKMVRGTKITSGINQPVLFETRTNDYSLYDPGYLDINGNFYGCPICVCYIQINKIINHNISDKNIEIDINIFSKDFSKYRNEVIRVRSHTDNIPRIINDINIYIDKNYPLDSLDIKRVFPAPRFSAEDLVISAVSKLELCFYEDSYSIPAKDNIFWEEIEVRNICKGKYVSGLIAQGLEKQCYKLEITEYGLLMIFDQERWSLPHYERRKLKDTSDIERRTNLIKGRLLIESMAKYDQNVQMGSYMMIA
jgi:hypothetical protein